MLLTRSGAISRLSRGTPTAPPHDPFPLSIHSSGRYLIDAYDNPFFISGDTPWSIAVQLTNTQINTYLVDRASRGFNAILFNALEHYFSSQTPAYENADGNAPFSSMTDFGSTPTEAYWTRVDYIVNRAKELGMVCIVNPAYLGYSGSDEGWDTEVSAESDADLQSYGAFLAERYDQNNVIWCLGGDAAGDTTLRNKQWNVVTGIRSVRTTDLITGHNARADSDAYSHWSGYSGFNLNNIYTDQSGVYSEAATAWARSGPIPFFLIEARYENELGSTAAEIRLQPYHAILSGACGHMFGCNPVWGFGEPHANGDIGPASAIASYLDTTGAQDMERAGSFFGSFQWWLLEPKTDASLVSSSLSSGTSRICPALSSDGTFALIWVPSSQTVTVVKSALSANPLRIRLFDPTTGNYSTHTESTSNSGSVDVATGGERVIVFDAA